MLAEMIERIRATVDWTLMPNDIMYNHEGHYPFVGESAVKCMFGSLMLANRLSPASVLDFAAGTGRVTRWIRAAFPTADLHVADINPDWTAWTAKTFNATGWGSLEDLQSVHAPRHFDLIWCGSLATHFSEETCRLLLRKFHDWLEPLGVAVISMHGRQFGEFMAKSLLNYFPEDVNDASRITLLHTYSLSQYGFVNYPDQFQGISMNSLEWAIDAVRRLDARVVTTAEHSWDQHHDILAFQKVT